MFPKLFKNCLVILRWIAILIKVLGDFHLHLAPLNTVLVDLATQQQIVMSRSCQKKTLDRIDIVHVLRHRMEHDAENGHNDTHDAAQICKQVIETVYHPQVLPFIICQPDAGFDQQSRSN